MSKYHEEYTKVKKGDLITLSYGEYSDYRVLMLVKALKEFNLKEQYDLFIKDDNNYTEYTDFFGKKHRRIMDIEDNFPLKLIEKGYVEEIKYKEYWIRYLW